MEKQNRLRKGRSEERLSESWDAIQFRKREEALAAPDDVDAAEYPGQPALPPVTAYGLTGAERSTEERLIDEDLELAEDDDALAFEKGDFTIAFMIQADKQMALRRRLDSEQMCGDGTVSTRARHCLEPFKSSGAVGF